MAGGLLVVYFGGQRVIPKGSYMLLRTSSTLLLLLKPWFSGNFYFHFTADGAPLRLDGHSRNFTPDLSCMLEGGKESEVAVEVQGCAVGGDVEVEVAGKPWF